MEQAFVKLLDENLECIHYKLKNDKIILLAKYAPKSVCCPYCGCISDKVHSEYQREIQERIVKKEIQEEYLENGA